MLDEEDIQGEEDGVSGMDGEVKVCLTIFMNQPSIYETI